MSASISTCGSTEKTKHLFDINISAAMHMCWFVIWDGVLMLCLAPCSIASRMQAEICICLFARTGIQFNLILHAFNCIIKTAQNIFIILLRFVYSRAR